MKYFATFDENGYRAASYTDALNYSGGIPSDAIEITEADQKLYASGKYKRGVDGEPELIPPVVEPIESIRARYIADLKLKRNTIEKSPVLYNENRFDFDDDSRDRINEAIDYMTEKCVEKQAWTLADNTQVDVTIADLKQVKVAAAERSGMLHYEYNQLKPVINASEDEQEMQAVVENAFATVV